MAGEVIVDAIYDAGLTYIATNGTRLDITSQVATTYTEAITTYSLGNKTSFVIGTLADDTSGRKITSTAITDGTVNGTGTATHWAITDEVSVLIATGPLSASQGVTDGNVFTLTAFTINFPDVPIT